MLLLGFDVFPEYVLEHGALALVVLELLRLPSSRVQLGPSGIPLGAPGERQPVRCGAEGQQRQRPDRSVSKAADERLYLVLMSRFGSVQVLPSVWSSRVQQQIRGLLGGQVLQNRLPVDGQRVPKVLGEELLQEETAGSLVSRRRPNPAEFSLFPVFLQN